MTVAAASPTTSASTAAALTAAANGKTSTTASGTNALQSLSSNYTMFLKLLTAQLQYQDPMNPSDSNTFTQQLVAYSQVEQQIKTNDQLSTLNDTTKASSNSNVALLNYLGKYTEVAGQNFPLQNSVSTMTYQLANVASKVTLDITDSSGTKVATFNGPTGSGLQKISWDGKDNSGTQLSDGTYTLTVTAEDAQGKPIAVNSQSMIGLVNGVERTDTGNMLTVGKMQIKESDVTNVFGSPSDKTS